MIFGHICVLKALCKEWHNMFLFLFKSDWCKFLCFNRKRCVVVYFYKKQLDPNFYLQNWRVATISTNVKLCGCKKIRHVFATIFVMAGAASVTCSKRWCKCYACDIRYRWVLKGVNEVAICSKKTGFSWASAQWLDRILGFVRMCQIIFDYRRYTIPTYALPNPKRALAKVWMECATFQQQGSLFLWDQLGNVANLCILVHLFTVWAALCAFLLLCNTHKC